MPPAAPFVLAPPESPPAPLAPAPEPDVPLFAEPERGLECDDVDARASFFAHPDPLKTIAGGERTFRIAPPQTSHDFGPCAWTPCITSIVRPQSEHW